MTFSSRLQGRLSRGLTLSELRGPSKAKLASDKYALRSPLLAGSRGLSTKQPYVEWSKDHVAKSTYPSIQLPPNVSNFADFVVGPGSPFSLQPESKLAVVEGVGRISNTFGDVRRDVEALRRANAAVLGMRAKDVVMIASSNHADYFSVFMGVSAVGGTVTLVNPSYTHYEIEHQLKASGARFVVAHPSVYDVVRTAVVQVGMDPAKSIITLDGTIEEELLVPSNIMRVSQLVQLGSQLPETPKVQVALDDVVALPFSSGTTGLSKGTMLTHKNLIANVLQIRDAESCNFTPKTVLLSPLPHFHIYGLIVSLMTAMYNGTTLVTMKRFELERLCELVHEYECDRAHLVPPIILSLAKSNLSHTLAPLRSVLSAAAPLGAEVEQALRERFPQIRVRQGWGMSELSPLATCTPENEIRSGMSGVPLANTEIKVVDVSTGKNLPPGQEGELRVRGPQVMKGYLNEPEKTREAIDENGWLSTGDIALIDKDGFLRITDRMKELVKYKGFQVAPAELEALLCSHAEIADACVVPRPDEEAGELPRAYVVLKAGSSLTSEAIQAWVAERVAPYKKLRGGVELIDSIPKTTSGKLLRRKVIEMDRERDPPAKAKL